MSEERAAHWDAAYAEGSAGKSWFQAEPGRSLDLLAALGVPSSASVVDIGGGASPLVDGLLARGHTDVTVLDVSAAALAEARGRVGEAPVSWLVADLLEWRPTRTFDVWHDRAVLHFLVEESDRTAYLEALTAATHPGSVVVLATFAPDGPEMCSGLPVRRYSEADLAALLGSSWVPEIADDEHHVTPWGSEQHFTWLALRRVSS